MTTLFEGEAEENKDRATGREKKNGISWTIDRIPHISYLSRNLGSVPSLSIEVSVMQQSLRAWLEGALGKDMDTKGIATKGIASEVIKSPSDVEKL